MKLFNFSFLRRKGFYVSVASIVTLLAAVISYTSGFTGVLLEYNSSNVYTISLLSIAAFAVLLLIELTSSIAPVVLWIGSFATFLVYINNIYMYFTGIFYNGVSAEAFQLIDPVVMKSTILFVISFVVANVAMYMNHSDAEEA
jgi:hypothetical protein